MVELIMSLSLQSVVEIATSSSIRRYLESVLYIYMNKISLFLRNVCCFVVVVLFFSFYFTSSNSIITNF